MRRDESHIIFTPKSKRHLFNNYRLRHIISILVIFICVFQFQSCKPEKLKGEIEFWTLQLSPAFDDYFKKIIREYEAKNPGIKIKWVDIPYDAVIPKLLSSIAAGDAPDVVNLSSDFVSKFYRMGTLYDISQSVPLDSLRNVYVKGALEDGIYNGFVAALPWYLNTYTIMYNKRLFQEAGFSSKDVPATFHEAVRFIREYKNRTGRFATFWNIGKDSYLPMMLESEGLSMVDSSFREVLFTQPTAIALLQEWINLYREGYLPRESIIRAGSAIIEPYQSGQIAFVFTGPVFLKRVKENAPAVYAETDIAPPLVGSTGAHELATMSIAVLNSTPDKNAATDFAMFVTNAQNQSDFCRMATIYPSTLESLKDEYFVKNDGTLEAKARIEGAKLLYSARRLRYFLKHPRFDELRDSFDEAIQEACLNPDDNGTALKKCAERWRIILQKN